jgi:Uma2 family endonuclease
MPDGDRFELVDGQLVERNMSAWSSYVAGELHGRLRDFSKTGQVGWVFPEGTSYRCFPDDADKVRKADVSFVRFDRLTVQQAMADGHLTLAPDWVAEVLSPNDLAYQVEQKVQDYLTAGVRLVWVIHPPTRTVHVHRREGTGTILRENDELDGEDVLPGFRCRVGDLFQPPTGVTVGTA